MDENAKNLELIDDTDHMVSVNNRLEVFWEFVSSSFPLTPHFCRGEPPFFADLSSELFFSMVTESEEAFNDGGKWKVPRNMSKS